MPIDYGDYPANWRKIRNRILERANGKCEWCGLENGMVGWREGEKFVPWSSSTPRGARQKPIRIVLTIAHLDHNIGRNDDANLAALCQRCHLRHDAKQHAANAARTRRRRQVERGQGELFE